MHLKMYIYKSEKSTAVNIINVVDLNKLLVVSHGVE